MKILPIYLVEVETNGKEIAIFGTESDEKCAYLVDNLVGEGRHRKVEGWFIFAESGDSRSWHDASLGWRHWE